MKVKAAPGIKVPKEGAPRKYIVEKDDVVEVPDTHYYRLRIRDEDLLLVSEEASQAKPTQDAAVKPVETAPAKPDAASTVPAAVTSTPAAATTTPPSQG